MAATDHPTNVSPDLDRPGLEPAPAPEANLHLYGDVWVASCPTCMYQLCHGRTQKRVERKARRILCPVCRGEDAA
jgi:hypothetical protein